jgi:hypothetical protein
MQESTVRASDAPPVAVVRARPERKLRLPGKIIAVAFGLALSVAVPGCGDDESPPIPDA